jgi:hypothetical protein
VISPLQTFRKARFSIGKNFETPVFPVQLHDKLFSGTKVRPKRLNCLLSESNQPCSTYFGISKGFSAWLSLLRVTGIE